MKQFELKKTITIAKDLIEHQAKVFGLSFEESLQAAINNIKNSETYENDQYKVVVRKQQSDLGDVIWLSICRMDRQPIHSWRDFQKIKNMLLGEEWYGYEVYPDERQLVDTANQYHLWCFPKSLGFGFNEGRTVNYESSKTTVQNPS